MLHVISLAQYATVYTRSWAVESLNGRVRLRAERDQALQELSWEREAGRIRDARMARIPAQRRPHYLPTERMAILELRAARGWSLRQAADAFQVSPDTVSSWMKRVDEEGPDALLLLPQPVNRFPDLVRYVVQRLKVLCPPMGKLQMAQMLARAGLHMGQTTVGRILKEKPAPTPKREGNPAADRVVTSRYPNHLWMIDMTVVPTGGGFWCSWFPSALPQRFPFARWVGIIVDQYSRRVQGFALFDHQPDSFEIRAFLGRTIRAVGCAPRHLISDKGPQFWPSEAYRRWCRRHSIRPRFGAIGKHGSIAVVERAILTMKQLLRELPSLPVKRESIRRELAAIFSWYNEHRPNTALAGSTPNEVYFRRRPANRRPRLEPRARWPRPSPCARPQILVAGQPGDRFRIRVDFHEGWRHLPIVSLQRAA